MITEFLPLYDQVVNWMEQGQILTPDKSKYGSGTIRNYFSRRETLAMYDKEKKIFLEDIDPEWADNFTIYLGELGLAKNTIANHVTGVKAILNILYKKKLSPYDGRGMSVRYELTTAIFNSIEDIQTLLNTELSAHSHRTVRDIYVMHCFIGLRFEDYKRFLMYPDTYLRQYGNKLFIDLKTAKTGEQVIIPVADIVKQLLGKYDYQFGDLFSYQFYNEEIKLIGEKAGLTRNIECTRTEGLERRDYLMRKCDMMSSHTARRTFATNAVLSKDFPIPAIMKITGHKSLSSFERYIRCNTLESAINVANNEFFQIPFQVQEQPTIVHNQFDLLSA